MTINLKNIIILLLISLMTLSCSQNYNVNHEVLKSETTLKSLNDNIYEDSINNFSIKYPINWIIAPVTSTKTVFKMGNIDSMISMSVNIQEIDSSLNRLPFSENELMEKTKLLTKAHLIMGDKLVSDIIVANSTISSYKALRIIWRAGVKIGDNKNLIFTSYDFEFNKNNKRYSLSLKGPINYLNKEMSIYYLDNYISTFKEL